MILRLAFVLFVLTVSSWSSAVLAQSASADRLALKQSKWFVHTFVGAGLWGFDYHASRSPISDGLGAPGQNVEAVIPALGAGIGVRTTANRVIGFRTALVLAGGSDFGQHNGFTAMLDGRFRVGPVARPFPWFFSVGPLLALAAFEGTYPNIEGKRGGEAFARAGFVVDTGFAFGEDYDFELGLEARLAAFPAENAAAVGLLGVGLTIGL